MGTLGASLLGNLLTGIEVMRVVESIIRAGEEIQWCLLKK